jgi:hypothetical protein
VTVIEMREHHNTTRHAISWAVRSGIPLPTVREVVLGSVGDVTVVAFDCVGSLRTARRRTVVGRRRTGAGRRAQG